MDNNKMDQYIEYINKNILPRINYGQLQEDYQTEEMAYAKSVLNALHKALVEVVGTDSFEWDTVEDGYALLPGII